MMARLAAVSRWFLLSAAVFAAASMLSLLIPEAHGNWTMTLTITGTVETGNFTPSHLTCEKHGHKGRRLTWSAVKGAEGYNVYHSGPFSHGKFDLVGEVKAPSTQYGGLRSSYFFHDWYVTSVFKGWKGNSTKIISVRCAPDTSFPGPKKPKGENHHSVRTVELAWRPVEGAVLYGVARAEAIDGDYDVLGTATDTAYTDTSVADGVTYYYVIVALDAEGNESDPSEVVSVADTLPGDTPAATGTPPDAPAPTDTPTAPDPEHIDEYTDELQDYVLSQPADLLEGVPVNPEPTPTPTPTDTPTATDTPPDEHAPTA